MLDLEVVDRYGFLIFFLSTHMPLILKDSKASIPYTFKEKTLTGNIDGVRKELRKDRVLQMELAWQSLNLTLLSF